MAFGMELGGEFGKLLLSLFRIVACIVITVYLVRIIRREEPWLYIACIALILAGALGNIVDSAVYGLLFSASGHAVAEFLPPEGGYATFLHGKVVDMLYFPIYRGILPDWIPIWGGKYFEFFRPVFNLADSAISIGVITIILFQRKFFPPKKTAAESESQTAGTQAANSETQLPD
jgi:signal peptidase II